MITPFLYKKQSKLTKILADVSYITFSEPKDGLVTSGGVIRQLITWGDCLTRNLDGKVLHETLWNPGGYSTKFDRKAPTRGPTPYPFICHFWQKKVPFSYTFYWQIVPSFTYLSKKFASSFNFFKRTIFKIWINHRPERFLVLFFFLYFLTAIKDIKASHRPFESFYRPE